MKNLVFAVVAAVSVLFLSGCVSGNGYVIEGTISAHRQLFCIWEQIPLRPGFTR